MDVGVVDQPVLGQNRDDEQLPYLRPEASPRRTQRRERHPVAYGRCDVEYPAVIAAFNWSNAASVTGPVESPADGAPDASEHQDVGEYLQATAGAESSLVDPVCP